MTNEEIVEAIPLCIEVFKADARMQPSEWLFQKYYIEDHAYYFSKIMNKWDYEYRLREDVAQMFSLEMRDVIIVGSSKLGFSVSPNKLYQYFDHEWRRTSSPHKKSDIDVAIVNRELFDRISKEVYDYSQGFNQKWMHGRFYTHNFEEGRYNAFEQYVIYAAKGWLRPDYMPLGFSITGSDKADVNPKIDALRSIYGRKVSIAIYSNWKFFKSYHISNLDAIKIQLKTGV